MNNWINLDDELPAEEEEVNFLVPFGEKIGGDVHLGYLLEGQWHSKSGEMNGDFVSHFMRIPETAGLVDLMSDGK